MVPPVTGPGQSTHSSVQFLNNVLSQRGPSALPYDEDVKWLIRQHLVSVIQEFPSLQAKTAMFCHTDGRTMNLLQAEGTVPMYYQDVMYNIPVTIWLLDSYPRQPPCVYVTPTRDMIIKSGHPHVNASGMVSIQYLQAWVFPSSNLVDLVRNLSLLFGQDPPLYTKQSAPQSRPSPPPPHTAQSVHMNPIQNSHMTSTSIPQGHNPNPQGALVRPPVPASRGGYLYNNHRLPPSPQRPPHMEDPSEVFKRNAINKLVEMLHNDMAELRKATETEMDGLFNTQAVLRQREEQLERGLREMQEEKEGLEQQLQLTLTNTDVLETWLRNNEDKKKDVDIDNVFELCDALSKQMLECSAADLAIEDILYSLDKAVQEGTIPVDAYLKNVRALSREQFFQRATAAKVRATQMQSQVASMASRVSYVS